MVKVEFDDAKVQTDDGVWLCLKLTPDSAPNARRFVFGCHGKRYDAELKEHRERRSLDANNYCWALLSQMADVLRTTKETLYLEKIKEIGPFKDFILTQSEAKTFRVAWSQLGTGWPTEQVDFDRDRDRVVIRAYYGSSTYNSRQMSRLIDGIIDDCQTLGIETLTPDKVALLKDEWNAQRDKIDSNPLGG